MDEDIISLLIYVALALVGVLASAFKKKKQQQQSMTRPSNTGVPKSFPADSEDYGPELGPLIELFEVPRTKPAEPEYETVESGPSVEEAGMTVESAEASAELAGLEMDHNVSSIEKPVSEVESFEEGQSDIQKMIAKYEAARKRLEESDTPDEISRGEIVSVEAEEAARQNYYKKEGASFFDARKAIIYSEILKRREI